MHGEFAGVLEELETGKYRFRYADIYRGEPVSLTLPLGEKEYFFDGFPAFFDGLLPEGMMLDALLRQRKLDRNDRLGQLLVVGHDLVGAVTVAGPEEQPCGNTEAAG
jgi:serine/threonine-protein kinase HipA